MSAPFVYKFSKIMFKFKNFKFFWDDIKNGNKLFEKFMLVSNSKVKVNYRFLIKEANKSSLFINLDKLKLYSIKIVKNFNQWLFKSNENRRKIEEIITQHKIEMKRNKILEEQKEIEKEKKLEKLWQNKRLMYLGFNFRFDNSLISTISTSDNNSTDAKNEIELTCRFMFFFLKPNLWFNIGISADLGLAILQYGTTQGGGKVHTALYEI